MKNPRCVYQQMKKHYSRYTPEQVSKITGTPRGPFLKICEQIAETSTPDKVMTILYALGWTQHSVGLAEHPHDGDDPAAARQHGQAGRRRERAARPRQRAGHHRHVPATPKVLPGYLTRADRDGRRPRDLPQDAHAEAAAAEPDGVLAELPEVAHQPDEGLVRQRRHQGERLRLSTGCPSATTPYDVLADVRAHAPGQDERLPLPGLQPARRAAEQEEAVGGDVEAQVPGDHRSARRPRPRSSGRTSAPLNDVDPAKIQTEVFRLPTTCFAEETGTLHQLRPRRCSGRKRRPSRRARRRPTPRSSRSCSCKLRDMYRKDGGAFPEPILNLTWPYQNAEGAARRTRCCARSTARRWST